MEEQFKPASEKGTKGVAKKKVDRGGGTRGRVLLRAEDRMESQNRG